MVGIKNLTMRKGGTKNQSKNFRGFKIKIIHIYKDKKYI